MEEKIYHIKTNDSDAISKIENYHAYGFATRKEFILTAVKMYDTFAVSKQTLKRTSRIWRNQILLGSALEFQAMLDTGVCGSSSGSSESTYPSDSSSTSFEDSEDGVGSSSSAE